MLRTAPVLNALLCLLLLLFLLAPTVSADTAKPPLPDEKGDYRNCGTQKCWIIVDKDWKNGLNGRLMNNFPKNWESEDYKWPEKPNINAWPVVIHFSPDTIINASQVNGVTITLDDNNGNPWLMVTIDLERVCFVRANSKYIKPVQTK